jgi:FkbH-like protein
MKLIEALQIMRQVGDRQGPERRFFLAVGFEPLHLRTFLTARLGQLFTSDQITLETGLYGDLATNIRLATEFGASAIFVKIEWDDLDPRLGFRALGGWSPGLHEDILDTVGKAAARLQGAIAEAAPLASVIVAGPNLPLAPVFLGEPTHLTPPVAHLHGCLQDMFTAMPANVTIIDTASLCMTPRDIADYKSLLTAGYPYNNAFTDTLSHAFASAAVPKPPMKGIITDLDNTLWRGIIGEDGPENIAWTQDDGAQTHGLYQQLLNALMDAGVFVAVASKNEATLIETAFDRNDMIFRQEEANPKEIHWDAKSQSVARILDAWNIGPDSVVFVDDNAAELGEVQSAFPDIDCRLFPTDDPNDAIDFLLALRSSFAKAEVSEEDLIRAQSIRQTDQFSQDTSADQDTHEAFLSGLQGAMTIDWRKSVEEKRSFELLNKTNQMNLNGQRWNWSDWTSFLSRDDSFQMLVHYEDRFGPLGRIAVIGGKQLDDARLDINYWAMSCRGFGRRIEHACLSAIFDRFDCRQIQFNFTATDRNQPMQRFLAECLPTAPHLGAASLCRQVFLTAHPSIYLKIEDYDGNA